MRFVRRRRWLPDLSRRLCAAATLVCYVLTAFGVPLPAAPVRKGSVPFICQARACGCQSAEQCWSGCCCFTPEERWAWARQHHIEPPDYAEAPRAGSWQSSRKRDADRPAACCTGESSPNESPTCCQQHKPEKQPSSDNGNHVRPPGTSAKKAPRTAWKLGIEALKCKGHSVLWVGTGATVRPAPQPIEMECPAPSHTLISFSATPLVRPLAPPDRPPRA